MGASRRPSGVIGTVCEHDAQPGLHPLLKHLDHPGREREPLGTLGSGQVEKKTLADQAGKSSVVPVAAEELAPVEPRDITGPCYADGEVLVAEGARVQAQTA